MRVIEGISPLSKEITPINIEGLLKDSFDEERYAIFEALIEKQLDLYAVPWTLGVKVAAITVYSTVISPIIKGLLHKVTHRLQLLREFLECSIPKCELFLVCPYNNSPPAKSNNFLGKDSRFFNLTFSNVSKLPLFIDSYPHSM
ncbi:hypothetical protein ACMAZD_09830 [Vibrio sp. nBUS_14]|uniref:hypothetical protein n=1 Tax=Vibrio sp. nBUS_14 TaxID=3395321 RepID=UPI003EBE74AE